MAPGLGLGVLSIPSKEGHLIVRKFLAALVAAFLLFAVAGSMATAATVEPAKSYGLCVSKSTGYVRALERTHLASSAAGKCKSTETKITLPSVTWPGPSKLVFVRGALTETCARTSATASTWTFNCVTGPTPLTPSPTPTS